MKCPFCDATLRSRRAWVSHIAVEHLECRDGPRPYLEAFCWCGMVYTGKVRRKHHDFWYLDEHWSKEGGVEAHFLRCQLLGKP